MTDVLGILPVSLVFGGIPYAIVAVVASLWMGGKSARAIRRLSFAMPLLMAAGIGILFGTLGLLVSASGATRSTSGTSLAAPFVLYTLIVGYFYVVMVEAIRFVAVRMKFLEPLP